MEVLITDSSSVSKFIKMSEDASNGTISQDKFLDFLISLLPKFDESNKPDTITMRYSSKEPEVIVLDLNYSKQRSMSRW